MHLSGAIIWVLLPAFLIFYIAFPIALVFLFKIVKPIGNCYIIRNFQRYSRIYGKTTAVVKSTDKFRRSSLICYNADDREIHVPVPYYIPHETISIIYKRCKYHTIIVDCPKLYHRVIIKNLITFATIFVSGLLILRIIFNLFRI